MGHDLIVALLVVVAIIGIAFRTNLARNRIRSRNKEM
jgi:hypothetical protein